ncbi:hypothetical protein E3J74_02155 [Candidatus Bathyarchaeota archaeon]|nr:MAG: hypothetical protein E3J74_02155 [Candidatus Bathyarchaeota archaeon]
MNEKITSLLLICLVTLAILYGCSSTALSNHTTRSIDAVPSGPTTVTEDPIQNGKLSCPKPNLDILGDEVDDVRPH